MLDGVPHLEDEAVDFARGLQFGHARVAQHLAQDAVVAPQQLRKEHGMVRLLDDECAQLGHDQPLVGRQVLSDEIGQHD